MFRTLADLDKSITRLYGLEEEKKENKNTVDFYAGGKERLFVMRFIVGLL